MKRYWHNNKYWDGLKLQVAFYFDFPSQDDYYKSNYNLHIVLFGLSINICTWKE